MRKHAAQIHTVERRLFAAFAVAIVFLASLYVFFVSSSVVNVVARKEAEQNIANISSHIGTLESNYLSKKDAITLELAYTMGFTDIDGKTFVARRALRAGLSLNQ